MCTLHPTCVRTLLNLHFCQFWLTFFCGTQRKILWVKCWSLLAVQLLWAIKKTHKHYENIIKVICMSLLKSFDNWRWKDLYNLDSFWKKRAALQKCTHTLHFAAEMNTSGGKTPTTLIPLCTSFEFRERLAHNNPCSIIRYDLKTLLPYCMIHKIYFAVCIT